ncbi:hypothetical protein K470DRAFT_267401 [Piedraia hortae CBS 480.64]|uniref:Amino acid permease/ SLC12A domain-containing protein n=1 Tax=Piedraia hortae CBS 480.64 TaxID=1314780 RepID=A0A6A7CBM3_9PEZI|nr:hypothetical protein K470DRAFT_267401 [Piedraia hortae CBS 480.64]
MSSSTVLLNSGPAGTLIAYTFIGTLAYSMIVALGEMVTYIFMNNTPTGYVSHFLNPSLAFAVGWTYHLSWAVTFAIELAASGLIIGYCYKNVETGYYYR